MTRMSSKGSSGDGRLETGLEAPSPFSEARRRWCRWIASGAHAELDVVHVSVETRLMLSAVRRIGPGDDGDPDRPGSAERILDARHVEPRTSPQVVVVPAGLQDRSSW
jgi:hypothetical protein